MSSIIQEARRYFEREINNLKEGNFRFRIEILLTIGEIWGAKKKKFPWWLIDKRIAISLNRSHISSLRREMRQNFVLIRECRAAINDLQRSETKTALAVLKKLNRYWRAYYRDNLGEHNDTLAVIIALFPGLGRALLPETSWYQGQLIQRELKLLANT